MKFSVPVGLREILLLMLNLLSHFNQVIKIKKFPEGVSN
jgi:hypothetical protein